jgi:hypothetical protein
LSRNVETQRTGLGAQPGIIGQQPHEEEEAALGAQPSGSGGGGGGGDTNTFEWLLRAHAHVQHNDKTVAAAIARGAQQAAGQRGPEEENHRSSTPGPGPGPGPRPPRRTRPPPAVGRYSTDPEEVAAELALAEAITELAYVPADATEGRPPVPRGESAAVDHYTVLGLAQDFAPEELGPAYRCMMIFHDQLHRSSD